MRPVSNTKGILTAFSSSSAEAEGDDDSDKEQEAGGENSN